MSTPLKRCRADRTKAEHQRSCDAAKQFMTHASTRAHIIVNRDFALPGEIEGMEGAYGEIVGSRIDYEFPSEPNIMEVPNAQEVRQIAILIKPHFDRSFSIPPALPNSPPVPLSGKAAQ